MKVASWNLARGLSNTERSAYIAEGLGRMDADLVFLPEAFDKTGPIDDFDFAKKLGYEILTTEYDDAVPHPSEKQYIIALSRTAAVLEVFRLNTRNALKANFKLDGEEISITGAHFDDRSEDIRIGMVNAFLDSRSQNTVSALIGDLNAMHGGDLRARVLSSSVARHFASELNNDRAKSLATRLTDMASGDVMKTLEQAGMKDADLHHRPTMLMGGLAVVQLDHLMYDDGLRVTSFQTHKFKGSDHEAISGTIELAA